MLNAQDAGSYIGSDVVDSDGDKIGTVGQVYLGVDDGALKWASVRTGFFGTSESFVPLDQADATADGIRVPYEKAFVKDAPRIDVDGALDHDDEDALYRYYGSGQSTDFSDLPAPTGLDTAPAAGEIDSTEGHDTSGPNTDDAMTRSEERLRVGTEKVEAGRARLRKYIVTEQQTVTVPVSHDEVRLEREPITDANADAAYSGATLSEEEHEIVLTEERPVVAKETVAVERVRLGKDTVTADEQVSADVRKEEIEFVDDTTPVSDVPPRS